MDVHIQSMGPEDWPQVAAIHREGILTGHATFETAPPESWDAFDREHLEAGRLVLRDGDLVLAWAALSPVSDRCVYGGVAEISVYVGEGARGRGLGRRLLNAAIEAAEEAGFWTLQAGIFPENEASLRLHEACGFRQVGRREKLGRLGGVWRDVLLLERRSSTVGRD